MKQPEVFKKIGGIIQELNEQYEYLQSASEHLNDWSWNYLSLIPFF